MYTQHTLVDVGFRFADGLPLLARGSGWRFHNCVWEWNRWALGSATPDQWSNDGTFVFSGMPPIDPGVPHFSRLSFANNGGSKAFRPPQVGVVWARNLGPDADSGLDRYSSMFGIYVDNSLWVCACDQCIF